MVLRDKHRAAEHTPAMASDQPVKKKQRIDAPDLPDGEDSYDALFAESATVVEPQASAGQDAVDCARRPQASTSSVPPSLPPGVPPGLHNPHFPYSVHTRSGISAYGACSRRCVDDPAPPQDLDCFQEHLVKQCLCGVSEESLRRPFSSRISIADWPPDRVLIFLSNLQLLFDVYLKQNYKGSICPRLMDVCDALVRNEYDWLSEVINLADHHSKFIHFSASRCVASFLIVAKDNIDHNWLQKIIENVYLFDTIDSITVRKINFSLDVIKRVVEWKDVDQHPLEDSAYINTSNPPEAQQARNLLALDSASSSTSHAITSSDNILQNAFSNLHTTGSSSSSLSSGINASSGSNVVHVDRPFKLHEPILKFPVSQPIHDVVVTPDVIPQLPTPEEVLTSHHHESIKVTEAADGDLQNSQQCITITVTDSESFDTSHIKCLTIKCLEQHWPALVGNVKKLLTRYLSITGSENCILTFLSLWENIISVKANLSVVDTKPFYMHLQSFVEFLKCTNLPSLLYTQLLSLFNEVLCYGSTLALQDILPEETCTLAHSIVRFVKDFRLLNDIRLRHSRTGFGFIGYESPLITAYSLESRFTDYSNQNSIVDPSYGNEERSIVENDPSTTTTSRSHRLRSSVGNETDKTMLQKMVLLVLKSVAVTVKEMRCDSSDSSIDSTDYNAIQDMQMVERSIRDVLKKLDVFLKNALDFLPESPFTKILIHLFSEQDDYLIESMVCTLDITVGIVYRNSVFPDLIPMLNPILTFIEFLEVVSHDSDVLLDYLVSNETCFLLYLLRFLKYVRRNWSKFVISCQWEQGAGSRGLDETMSVLIRLRLQISRLVSKSLFPYNISPVLRLLEVCESLYEGNELS